MINNEKILAFFKDYGARSLKLFGYYISRSQEHDFILNNISPRKTMIMDIGSKGSLFSLKRWMKLIKEAGFDILSVDTVEFPLINNDFLRRYMTRETQRFIEIL